MNFATRRRTILCFLLSIVCYTVVFSYTTQLSTSTRKPFRRRRRTGGGGGVPSSLLFFSVDGGGGTSTSRYAISDTELVRSIVAAKSTREVDKTLRAAILEKTLSTNNNNGHEKTTSRTATTTTTSTGNRQRSGTVGTSALTTNQTTSVVLDLMAQHDETTTTICRVPNDEHEGGGNDNGQHSTIETFPQLTLNVTAAALRTLAHVSIREARRKITDKETQILRKELLSSLLKTISHQIIRARRRQQQPGEEDSLGAFAMTNLLQGLAVLTNERTLDNMQPLATLVVETMEERYNVEVLYKLGPLKLVQCLQALVKLQLGDRPLRYTIYTRLLKPDAVSKLPPAFLSHGLSALAAIESKDKDSFLLARSFMRRLRKQKVRDEANMQDLCKALVACDTLLKTGSMEGYEDEASIFGFTTLRAILKKKEETGHTFTAKEMSNVLSAWATLSTGDREDTVIADLLSICQEQNTLKRCNIMELEKIVSSLEKLHLTSKAEVMTAAGERLLTLVQEQLEQGPVSRRFNPKVISDILRCPVLLNRKNLAVMDPYVIAASKLFVDEHFLNRCRVGELANFLWFMSMSNLNTEEELTAIVHRILDPTLVDNCSPKLASRILGTYTSIVSTASAQGAEYPFNIGPMTSQLFHGYGGHLLTTQLTPAEVSTTLYAYAKVAYVHDMGIYDHLVSLMASAANECSARQLTQGLWSCGKMIAWEKIDHDEEKQEATPAAPYVHHAVKIATELSSRQGELSQVDVTQCIWALGRLGIKEPDIVEGLAKRAEYHANSMNGVEISNILWGLAKIEFDDTDSVLLSTLSERLTSDGMYVQPKAAATALYALGKLEVRNEYLFDKLSQVMISEIEHVSAQGVANALWAHQRVQLRPPNEMLNRWAIQKLGVTGLQFRNPKKSA